MNTDKLSEQMKTCECLTCQSSRIILRQCDIINDLTRRIESYQGIANAVQSERLHNLIASVKLLLLESKVYQGEDRIAYGWTIEHLKISLNNATK